MANPLVNRPDRTSKSHVKSPCSFFNAHTRKKVDGQTVITTPTGAQYVATKQNLGEGHFCKVKLAKKAGSNEPLALRKIKSQREFDQQEDNLSRNSIIEATRQEVVLYQKLQKKIDEKAPIAKMVDCVETANSKNELQFYQFFPLADLGNCESFYKKIPSDLPPKKYAALYRHIANLIIRGTVELNKHNFFVRDLKLENVLINSDSSVYLSDFGAAIYFSKHHTIATSALTDKRYQPPYKLIALCSTQKERASLQDQWALGLTLLEAWNNPSINKICGEFFILRDKYKKQLTANDTLLDAENLRHDYKLILEKLEKSSDFLHMPIYLRKIILTLLSVEPNSRKKTLEELIQPFKKALTLSQKQMELIKNNFQNISHTISTLKEQNGNMSQNKYNYYTTHEAPYQALGFKK